MDPEEGRQPPSFRPRGQDNNPGAGLGLPSCWAHDVADPSTMGLVDPSMANSIVPPVAIEDQAEVEIQAVETAHNSLFFNNPPAGSDLANFVPNDGGNSVDIFPEINQEERVHLLQR